jgi:hypothetical protein
LEPRDVPNGIPATYVEVEITNHTGQNHKGVLDSDIHIFVQSQTQIYQITNVGTTSDPFYLASVTGFVDGPAPSVTLASLKQSDGTYVFYLDSSQQLTSGRIYFSDSKSAVTISGSTINGPAPNAPFNFDFIELTLNAAQGINLDTSQVDQFGMPIKLNVTPLDDNFPNGTGIVATSNRAAVIQNFQDLTNNANFTAYAASIESTPARLIAPQHVIQDEMPQAQLSGNITGAASQSGTSTATFTLTGNWNGPLNPPPTTQGLNQGMSVSGQGIPPGATIQSVSSGSLVLQSTLGNFTNTTGTNVAFYPAPTTTLATAFDQAIYDLFNYYTTHDLYLVANGTNSGPEIYAGRVITDFKLPAGVTDINGNTDTTYTVFQFTGTGYLYKDPNNALSPATAPEAGQTNIYQIFYP